MIHPKDIDQLVRFYEHLQPSDLAHLGEFYAPDALFKDPFNDVQGITAIRGIFEHMFHNLSEPHFVVTQQVVQGPQCFLTWDFVFRFKRFDPETVQTIRGASHLVFDERGLVALHRDYWDAAEELYEKLPWVGGVMRWLKQRSRS
ncbi:MAG: hypothetical protein RL323_565 [Pseudomonadota bacterium]|jgi:hypothetical protein